MSSRKRSSGSSSSRGPSTKSSRPSSGTAATQQQQFAWIDDGLKVTSHEHLKWTDEQSKLECPICTECVFAPPNLNCSHLACRSCVRGIVQRKCPTCRVPFPSSLQTNHFVQQQIYQRAAFCIHKDDGCEWSAAVGTEYRTLIQHADTCGYRRVRCLLCQGALLWRNATAHQRECPARLVECEHCGETMKFCDLAAHQLSVALKSKQKRLEATLPCVNMEACVNGCKANDGSITLLLKKNAEEHYSSSCPMRLDVCPCCSPPKMLAHSQLMGHIKSILATQPDRAAQRMVHAADEIASLKEEVERLEDERDTFKAALAVQNGSVFIWRFPLAKYRRRNCERKLSDVFKIDKMKWRIICRPKGSRIPGCMAAYLECCSSKRKYPQTCRISFRVLHPSGDPAHHLPWRTRTHTFTHAGNHRGFKDLLDSDQIDEYTFPDGNVVLAVTTRKINSPPVSESEEDDE